MRNLALYRYIDTIARTGSIRKAAEILAITPSALNRRLLSLEEELGIAIFERLGRGVRLNTAGEILIRHFRLHLSNTQDIKSQLADLSGLRAGTVSIACSQAFLPFFLPDQFYKYQLNHPAVRFSIHVRDGEAAASALMDFTADLALVFEPLNNRDFQTIVTVPQRIHAVLSRTHPLADRSVLQLSDCLSYPLALPAAPYAVRTLLEGAAKKMSVQLEPSVEAESYVLLRNYTRLGEAITFELEIGLPPPDRATDLRSIPLTLDTREEGLVHLAHLRGRTPSVASAKFAQQLSQEFETNYTPL